MGMPSGISLFIISLFMIMPLVMLVNVAISEFNAPADLFGQSAGVIRTVLK